MMSKMEISVLIAAFALALTGCASVGQPLAGEQDSKRYELNDGSVLMVDANGRMRMFSLYGNPLYMKDGVAMKLSDGTTIVMKENAIWRELRLRRTLSPRG
jgi:hypothetical protein